MYILTLKGCSILLPDTCSCCIFEHKEYIDIVLIIGCIDECIDIIVFALQVTLKHYA